MLALVPGTFAASMGLPTLADANSAPEVHPGFPSLNPEKVREVVGASHRDLAKVKELVTASPALAKAVWDWGYGDFETALGAASHTGQREIAEFLVSQGARPDIFYFAMMGHVDAVKGLITADPRIVGFQGPHGLTLMHHARAGGDEAKAVVAYLETVADADKSQTNLELSDAAKEQYIGRYAFASGPDDFMEVLKHRLGWLQLKRGASGNPVRLNRVGDHEFAPGGAPAVRIRFVMERNVAKSLAIYDPDVILSASR